MRTRTGGLGTRIVAEFISVAAGVLVAITINGWAQDRGDRRRKAIYLNHLVTDLKASEQTMKRAIDGEKEANLAAIVLIRTFWSKDLSDPATVKWNLIRAKNCGVLRSTTGTARALINSGNIDLMEVAEHEDYECESKNPYGTKPGYGISLPDYYRPTKSVGQRNREHETSAADCRSWRFSRAAGEGRNFLLPSA